MKKRSAPPNALARVFAAGAAVAAAALLLPATGSALPPPSTDRDGPAPSPSPTVAALASATTLQLGTSVLFVLDGKISSKYSRSGDAVRAHLREDLKAGGGVVAKAGTPVTIKISDVRGAKAPDQDGSVDITFEPIALVNDASLPLYAPTSHLTVHVSAGAESTAGITDQLKDIFIPGHMIYRIFRKGAELQLDPGTIVRARTSAAVDGSRPGAPVVIPPPSLTVSTDTPHAGFKPLPFYTSKPKLTPLPRATPTPAPASSAQPSPSP